jgi:hypothetical protein
VTFQRADKILVEDRQFTLEEELCEQLAPDQTSKLFVDDVQRLRFGCAYHKGRGKVIKIHNPSQTHLDFVQHADKLLSSPLRNVPAPISQKAKLCVVTCPQCLQETYPIVGWSKHRPLIPAL